jgi:hypothetical protein
MRRVFSCMAMALVLSVAGSGVAAVFNVSDETELRNALNTSGSNGRNDRINIDMGIYNTSGNTFSYAPVAAENYSLTIVGAGVSQTILDGGNSDQVMNIDTTGVTNDSDSHISITGVTCRNGREVPAPGEGYGGGLYVGTVAAHAIVENCEFINNAAGEDGGGAEVTSVEGDITLANNRFAGNSCEDDSAAAWAWSNGGTVTLRNNIFSGNSANFIGGALAGSNTGVVELINNIFGGNSASTGYGGSAAVFSDSGTVTITNNTFYGNSAFTDGGGLYVWLQYASSTANIYNNICWGNTKGMGSSGGDLYVNDEGRFPPTGTGATVNLYNNDFTDFYIKDGDHLFEGDNIDEGPLFVDVSDPDPIHWDLHITFGSPCRDAGTAAAPSLPATDFEDDSRSIGVAPDIGADEFQPPPYWKKWFKVTTAVKGFKSNASGLNSDSERIVEYMKFVDWDEANRRYTVDVYEFDEGIGTWQAQEITVHVHAGTKTDFLCWIREQDGNTTFILAARIQGRERKGTLKTATFKTLGGCYWEVDDVDPNDRWTGALSIKGKMIGEAKVPIPSGQIVR